MQHAIIWPADSEEAAWVVAYLEEAVGGPSALNGIHLPALQLMHASLHDRCDSWYTNHECTYLY